MTKGVFVPYEESMKQSFNLYLVQGFWARLRGVKSFKLSNGFGFYFPNCKAVHTFGVKTHLGFYWVDKNGKILRINRPVTSSKIKCCLKASGAVETQMNNFQLFKVGDTFKLPGQALLESALVLPVLFLLLFGFLELSLVLQAQQRLVHHAHMATQVVSLTNSDQKLAGFLAEQYDLNQLIISIENFSATTQQPLTASERRYNDLVKVKIRLPYALSIPFLKRDIFELLTQAQARILCQNSVAPYQCD